MYSIDTWKSMRYGAHHFSRFFKFGGSGETTIICFPGYFGRSCLSALPHKRPHTKIFDNGRYAEFTFV